MKDMQKEAAEKYQEFFNFMNQEHNLILTVEQMDEIVLEAQRLVKKLTIPDVNNSGKNTCPDCGDKGWLYDEDGKKIGTCPCHYL